MKDLDQAKDFIPGDTLSGTLLKAEQVGRSIDGGYYVDLTLAGGIIVEATIGEDKLQMLNERLLEDIFLVVKPLEANRYECTCIVIGKAPEFKH